MRLGMGVKRERTELFFLSFFIFYKFIYFIYFYFWLHWVFVVARGLSLVAASGGYSWLPCEGFSLRWLLLLRSTGSKHVGLVAPWHVGSSRTRVQTCVPCFGRQVLNHCATREAPELFILHLSELFGTFSLNMCICYFYFKMLT